MALPEYRWVSVEEYLAIDNASDVRFEYVHGQLRMRTDGNRNYALIAHNLHGLLHNHLGGTPCAAYTSDMRAQVAIDRYYYPDVTVSCDENEAENALNSPRVVFEVLSPGTEVIDRTEKLEAYRELLSLEDYVLVSSDLRCPTTTSCLIGNCRITSVTRHCSEQPPSAQSSPIPTAWKVRCEPVHTSEQSLKECVMAIRILLRGESGRTSPFALSPTLWPQVPLLP